MRGKQSAPSVPSPFQPDIETLFGQRSPDALRPFDKRNAARERLAEAQFLKLLLFLDSIKVEMPERERAKLISLNDREARARHLLRLEAGARGKTADETACERGLARTKLARERDDIPWPYKRGKPPAERKCRRRIRQIHTGFRARHLID